MADSSAPGFLLPIGPAPKDDDDLLDALQPIIAAIAQVEGKLVRPRWQTRDQPSQPDYAVNWIGFGIARTRPDTYQYEEHDPRGDGSNVFEYSEELDVLISCYGPQSQGYARRVRDGFRVEQNRVPLQAMDMDTLFIGEPVTLPALMQSTWVRRVDITLTLRRVLTSRYGVLTIRQGPAIGNGLDNGLYTTPITVERIDL